MKCPIDNSDLVMSDRQGIEIDYCPKCRGVWLDRGELDKIIERSASDDGPRQVRGDDDDRRRSDDDRHDDRGYGRQQDYRPRKKKSLLGEIFDF
jgi:uncharacterized protein